MYPNGTYQLAGQDGAILKKKAHGVNLKPFFVRAEKLPSAVKAVAEVEKAWIEDLHLYEREKQILEDPHGWLNDALIDAAIGLLRKEFGLPDVQATCVQQAEGGLEAAVYQTVQILHLDGNHWVASWCLRGRVELANSLRGKETEELKRKLAEKYRVMAESGQLTVHKLRVQLQPDGSSCGLFAIANVVEVLNGQDCTKAMYNLKEMRPHLAKCLENRKMNVFPKSSVKPFPPRATLGIFSFKV